jgi:hypothetical protein
MPDGDRQALTNGLRRSAKSRFPPISKRLGGWGLLMIGIRSLIKSISRHPDVPFPGLHRGAERMPARFEFLERHRLRISCSSNEGLLNFVGPDP